MTAVCSNITTANAFLNESVDNCMVVQGELFILPSLENGTFKDAGYQAFILKKHIITNPPAASRGLLVLALSWYIAYTKQVYRFSTEGLQSFAMFR